MKTPCETTTTWIILLATRNGQGYCQFSSISPMLGTRHRSHSPPKVRITNQTGLALSVRVTTNPQSSHYGTRAPSPCSSRAYIYRVSPVLFLPSRLAIASSFPLPCARPQHVRTKPATDHVTRARPCPPAGHRRGGLPGRRGLYPWRRGRQDVR
jgi:hypothetical protein